MESARPAGVEREARILARHLIGEEPRPDEAGRRSLSE